MSPHDPKRIQPRTASGYRAKHQPVTLTRFARMAANAETCFLGSLLISDSITDAEAIQKGISLVAQCKLYGELEQIGYDIIAAFAKENRPIDSCLVAADMCVRWSQLTGGAIEEATVYERIMYWMDSVPSAINIEHYAQAVVSAYRERESIIAVNTFGSSVESGDELEKSLPVLSERLDQISAVGASSDLESGSIRAMLPRYMQRLNEQVVPAIPSGLTPLDEAIKGGAKNGQLIIIGARPSHGKSTLGAQWAFMAAKREKWAKFFCYETEDMEVMAIWANMFGFNPADDLQIEMFQEYQLCYCDSASWTISRIESEAKAAKNSGRLDILVIDYLQLIAKEDSRDNDLAHLTDVTRRLKQLARTLKIPVIALAQLNREIESRDNKTPVMRDLRGCGTIESDADIVVAIWKDDPSKLHVIKQRDGGQTAVLDITLHPQKGYFVEAATEYNGPTWE